jgi:hypothetical protein
VTLDETVVLDAAALADAGSEESKLANEEVGYDGIAEEVVAAG